MLFGLNLYNEGRKSGRNCVNELVLAMEKDLQKIIEGAKLLKHTFIGKCVNDEEVEQVWKAVGCFIRKHLVLKKAAIIPDIGTFTLSAHRIQIGHHPIRYIYKQIPIFQISNSLSTKYRLRWERLHTGDCRPQVSLNLTMISNTCQVPRSRAKICVREVMMHIENQLAKRRIVRIPFFDVGTLAINPESGEHKMEYSKDFIQEFTQIDVRIVDDVKK